MTSLGGVVRRSNRLSGIVAIELDADDYVIAEVIDHVDHVQIGDVLMGDLAQHGYTRLRNMSKGFELRARIIAVGATPADRDLLLR